jgi:DNA-binding NarL/FixJ family response regulator
MLNLTPRQREVCELLIQGKPAKEIAAALNISVGCVKTQLRWIYARNQIGTGVDRDKLQHILLAIRYDREKDQEMAAAELRRA